MNGAAPNGDAPHPNGVQGSSEPRPEVLTRLLLDRPSGQLAAALGDEGEWFVKIRRDKGEEWRTVCKGNLTLFSVATDLPRPLTGPLIVGSLEIDPAAHRVFVEGEEVDLTKKEFLLLQTLAKEPGRVFQREDLYETVWGYEYMPGNRSLSSHVSRLRRILGAAGAEGLIVNCWGVGYSLTEPLTRRSR